VEPSPAPRLRLDLTSDELADLRITLGGELKRLTEEIRAPASERYHDVLRRRRDRLSHLIRVLAQPFPAADSDADHHGVGREEEP
jgi:hypothetical protein